MPHHTPRLLPRVLGIAILIALCAPALAAADPFGPEKPGGFDDRLMRHADELGLDDATRARIEELAGASRTEGRKLHEQVREERVRLRELLSQAEPDLAAVLAQADAITAAEGQALRQRLETTVAIRALLTPEQRQQLVARTSEIRGRFEGMREERIRQATEACAEEIARSCEDYVDDPRRLRRCLRASDSLSPACAEQLFQRRRPRPERGF